MNDNKPEWVLWLARHMERKGITQAELARRTKYTPSYVSILLSGTRTPKPRMVMTVIEGLGKDISEEEATEFHRLAAQAAGFDIA